MRRRLLTPGFIVLHIVALHALIAWFDGPGRSPTAQAETANAAPVPDALPEAEGDDGPSAQAAGYELPKTLPGALDLRAIYPDNDQMLATLGNDWTAELTTDVRLQAIATKALNRARVPFGAVVVLNPKTGDVLAMADRYDETHPSAPKLSKDGPPHLALRAVAPAASVFKIITATALLENGLNPDLRYPYVRAKRRIYKQHLDAPPRGAQLSSVGDALAKSNNGFFARQSSERLTRESLEGVARRFGFNKIVPFPLATDASTVRVPRNSLERARMSAGFWHSRLTPLHGALIAAAVANDGSLPTPRLVKTLISPDGQRIDSPKRGPFAEPMTAATARQLRKMMARTIRVGTGRRAFKKWPKSLRHIAVGGKTGTLALRDPYTFYTWFVGYAPVDDPQVAIAVMVGNGEKWWQRGIDVAQVVLSQHFLALERDRKDAQDAQDAAKK
ncbi:MAG: peptidoglycan glycosyltransferase [Bradymonadia bacterium]|jgi:peptidoglycan glycosyltransferase